MFSRIKGGFLDPPFIFSTIARALVIPARNAFHVAADIPENPGYSRHRTLSFSHVNDTKAS